MSGVSRKIPKHVLRNSYRQLYKAGLAAVCYSIPARYDLRDTLRRAFRGPPSPNFSLTRIENTVRFFRTAAEQHGMEHKIVKNLMFIHYWRYYKRKRTALPTEERYWEVFDSANNNFLEIIGLLNQSMDLDLR